MAQPTIAHPGESVMAECLVEAYPNTINYWMKHQKEMLLNG